MLSALFTLCWQLQAQSREEKWVGTYTSVVTAELAILNKMIADYDRCLEEPEFCSNGATCERVWTTARCHCVARFHGDRCDECSDQFEQNGCTECVPDYYGADCGNVFPTLSSRTPGLREANVFQLCVLFCSQGSLVHDSLGTSPTM